MGKKEDSTGKNGGDSKRGVFMARNKTFQELGVFSKRIDGKKGLLLFFIRMHTVHREEEGIIRGKGVDYKHFFT